MQPAEFKGTNAAVNADRPKGLPKGIYREADVVTQQMVWDALPVVTDWIERSRSAATVDDHAALQSELAGAAIEVRDLDQSLKADKKAARAEVDHARPSGDRSRLGEINTRLRGLDSALAANRRRLVALRAVQDGIIWRLLGFDRAVITSLGLGAQVGYPSASFDAEFATAASLWESGKIALLTDLSSCIRTGDLLVFDPEFGTFAVRELKESTVEAGRYSRQREQLEARVRLVSEGRSLTISDRPTVLSMQRPELRTHLSVLGDLIARAGKSIVSGAVVADHLHVAVVDARAAGNPEDEEEALRRVHARHKKNRRLPSRWHAAHLHEEDSYARLQRDEHAAMTTTAPYSIYPFDPETCAALCLGLVRYQTVVNLSVIEQALRRRGYWLQPSKHKFIWFDVIKKGAETEGHSQGVNLRQREQLVAELVSLSAFVDSVDAGFAQAEQSEDPSFNWIWAWSNEAATWR